VLQVDAGVADELVMGDPTAPRFVFWKNKLRATPDSPVTAVMGDFLSFPGKIRAGLGAVGLFKDPPPGKEESVKEFISRNLGPEVFYRLIEPFCSGVYAGNPEKLSMKAAFGRIQVRPPSTGVSGVVRCTMRQVLLVCSSPAMSIIVHE
jgi:protoporphyrinogen/coproporphyrinogen III oxidase